MTMWTSTVPTLGLLRSLADRHPQKLLVQDGTHQVTYSATNSLADGLADAIRNIYGVNRGDRVVCVSNNGPAFLLTMVAVQRLGAIFVPIAARRMSTRLDQVLADCAPVLVLATPTNFRVEGAHAVVNYESPDGRPRCQLRTSNGLGAAEISLKDPTRSHNGPPSEACPAMLLYTSGSTGKPKGIVVSYTNQCSALASILEYLELPSSPRILNALSPAFDYGLYQYLMSISLSGSMTTVRDAVLADEFIRRIFDYEPSVVPLVPTMIRRLNSIAASTRLISNSVRVITTTGSPLDRGSTAFLMRAFPKARIYSMYGLTECKRVSYLAPSLLATKPTSVGRPMPNCEAVVLDDSGKEVRVGEVGELFVSGPNVSSGYWGDSEATRVTFRRNTNDGRVVLATGDLFSRDGDGDLYFHGRRDDLVKVNDQRISLTEVEQVVRAVDGVIDVVASLEPYEGVGILVIHVQAAADLSDTQLRAGIRRNVPLGAMVPRRIYRVDTLRLTETGKVSRHQYDVGHS